MWNTAPHGGFAKAVTASAVAIATTNTEHAKATRFLLLAETALFHLVSAATCHGALCATDFIFPPPRRRAASESGIAQLPRILLSTNSES